MEITFSQIGTAALDGKNTGGDSRCSGEMLLVVQRVTTHGHTRDAVYIVIPPEHDLKQTTHYYSPLAHTRNSNSEPPCCSEGQPTATGTPVTSLPWQRPPLLPPSDTHCLTTVFLPTTPGFLTSFSSAFTPPPAVLLVGSSALHAPCCPWKIQPVTHCVRHHNPDCRHCNTAPITAVRDTKVCSVRVQHLLRSWAVSCTPFP